MAEYEVTQILEFEDGPEHLCGSVCELGEDAGRYTWNNCLDLAGEIGESLGLDYDDVRDHFRDYGDWEGEEIDAWTDREMQALVIQEAASAIRDTESEGYNEEMDGGRIHVDTVGRLWLYIGH